MKPRNLRLLIIDDLIRSGAAEREKFEARHIELLHVPLRTDQQRGVNWFDLLKCAATPGETALVDFDLLVLDIIYGADKSDRDYLRDDDNNPLGLVHGLAAIAVRRANPMPFGWTLRSFSAALVKDDPVALVAYGHLLAMAGSPGSAHSREGLFHDEPDENAWGWLQATLSDRLEHMRRLDPDEAWKPALEAYRARLLHDASEGLIFVKFSRALPRSVESWPRFRAEAVATLIARSIDHISVTSLFADVPGCSIGNCSESCSACAAVRLAQEWLASVDASLRKPVDDVWRAIEAREHTTTRIKAARSNPILVLALLTCGWLKFRTLKEPAGSGRRKGEVRAMLAFCGFQGEDTEESTSDYNQLLAGLRANSTPEVRTPTDLAQMLRSGWPGANHPVIYEVGRRWLKKAGIALKHYPLGFADLLTETG